MKKTALVLRCCAPDMTSRNGFKWPGVGEEAIAPDWIKNTECGNGLHGWLYGQGDHSSADYWQREGAKWLVIEVDESPIVMLGGKCKFPRGIVRFVGEKHEAAAYLIEHELRAANVAVIGASLTVGDAQTVMVGALGTATAGAFGTATAGDRGTATAGDSGTATAGDRGELRIRWYDNKANRYRTAVAYVGENGIEPNVPYRLNENHEFVRAE